MSDTPTADDDAEADPHKLIPIEAARAALMHWWREPIAGAVSIAVGAFDTWHYGKDAGLTSSVDELLILGGVVLIAGTRRLFAPPAAGPPPPDSTHPRPP